MRRRTKGVAIGLALILILIAGFIAVWLMWFNDDKDNYQAGWIDNGDKWNIDLEYIPEKPVPTEPVQKVFEYPYNNDSVKDLNIKLGSKPNKDNIELSYVYSNAKITDYTTLVAGANYGMVVEKEQSAYIYLIITVIDANESAYYKDTISFERDEVVVLTFSIGAMDLEESNYVPIGEAVSSDIVPDMPTNVLGCGFGGWHLDKECTIPADFSQGFTTSTTLYAGKYVETDRIKWNGTDGYTLVPGTTNLSGDVIIPNKYNDGEHGEANITAIQEGWEPYSGGAFVGLTVDSLTLPSTITTIGSLTFTNCDIGTLKFGPNSSGVTIDVSAFYGEAKVRNVIIPKWVNTMEGWEEMMNGAETIFVEEENSKYTSRDSYGNECNVLVEIATNKLLKGFKNAVIPDNISVIGESAFSGVQGLNDVIIPKTVISIEAEAFYHADVKSVTFEQGAKLESIGYCAFSGCEDISRYVIPKSVTSLGVQAIDSNATIIEVEDGNLVYDSRNNCNAIIETETNTLLFGCKNTIIPTSVVNIGSHAFSWCGGMSSIVIPNNIETIGASAFSSCINLSQITLSNNLRTIGKNAFGSCSIVSIAIPNSVETIADYAFQRCSVLESVTFEQDSNLTSIGYSAFSSCGKLSSVTFAEGSQLTAIGESAFSSCSMLINITIPAGVTSIGTSAFSSCGNLSSVTFEQDSNLTSIGNSAFSSCSTLINITIPAGVTSIGNWAFSSCGNLSSVTFSEGSQLTAIGEYAFYKCSSLTGITIPASVTSIGSDAFSSCGSLTITMEDADSTWKRSDYYYEGEWETGLTSAQVASYLTNEPSYYYVKEIND